ncbi:MAG: PHP domain-containing protein [Eubacteriales bacterium]
MKADLHIHSFESDGTFSVEEILSLAEKAGVNTIAITDHETVVGVTKAQKIADKYGITVIPGVEFHTSYKNEEIHLLGYFKHVNSDYLLERMKHFRTKRTEVTKKMLNKLNSCGLELTWEEVLETASNGGIVCKAHIIYAIQQKYQKTKKLNLQKISSWFSPGEIAYVPYLENPFNDAVNMIFKAGGIPVLAHPGLINNPSIIKDLLSYRPIGVEVYYGYWSNRERQTLHFQDIYKSYGILATGGSDFHGDYSKYQIGEIEIPSSCIIELLDYLDLCEKR